MKAKRLSFTSVADGMDYIRGRLEIRPNAPLGPTKGLPLGSITVCEKVFQRRDVLTNRHGRDEHVRDLARAIKDNPGDMEPIDVWWGGDGWYLLDGHHRVLAYESLKFTRDVPARVVPGGLDEALVHVGKANSRNKLPMTSEERKSLAVFYVCQFPERSVRSLGEMSGVSKTQIARMKKTIDQVVAQGHTRADLLGTSWYEIQRLARGDANNDHDHEGEMRQTANEIKRVLGPILGKKPHLKAQALAMALEEISPALYQGMLDWSQPMDDLEDEPVDVGY